MWTRRSFFALPAGVIAASTLRATHASPLHVRQEFDLISFERARILRAANRYLKEAPVTVTAATSPRSAGGRHDYFSEGDYWWPDPQNPGGPYIQRDGESNPGNFLAHRAALMRLSVQVPALAAGWVVTKDRRYADHARRHLRAWFMDDATHMAPHLLYSQAIHGRFTGRGIGIIDTVHLVEVARAIAALDRANLLPQVEQDGCRDWFSRYLTWMTTHQYGIDEREARKKTWPHKPDVMYFDEWPVRQPALWFGGRALKEPSYIEMWKKLKPDPTVEEVIRNYFIRQPVLWNEERRTAREERARFCSAFRVLRS